MKTILPVLAAVLLAGCASSDSVTLVVSSDEPAGFTVVSVNPSLSRSAEPITLKRGLAEDGVTPKIGLLLQNSTAWAQRLNYRVEWLSSQDMPLQGQVDVVRPLTVPAGSYQTIVSVAPSQNARGFRVWLTEVGAAGAAR